MYAENSFLLLLAVFFIGTSAMTNRQNFCTYVLFSFSSRWWYFLYSISDFKTLNVNFVLLLHKYYVLVMYYNYVHILCFCINTFYRCFWTRPSCSRSHNNYQFFPITRQVTIWLWCWKVIMVTELEQKKKKKAQNAPNPIIFVKNVCSVLNKYGTSLSALNMYWKLFLAI